MNHFFANCLFSHHLFCKLFFCTILLQIVAVDNLFFCKVCNLFSGQFFATLQFQTGGPGCPGGPCGPGDSCGHSGQGGQGGQDGQYDH